MVFVGKLSRFFHGAATVWKEERERRRKEAQRRDVRTQMLAVSIRLDEARRYVDRDRTAERKERDRLIQQRQIARDRLTELEDLLRQYLLGQSILDAEHVQRMSHSAREALDSGFTGLDQTSRGG